MIIDPYRWHQAHILAIDRVSIDTITIRFERPATYKFLAGQYAITRIYTSADRFLVRQYSFSSPPSADWLEFTVQHEPGGEVTTWLHQHAKVGDMLEISQSYGHFTPVDTPRPLLYIAGRVGIAPFMSHLRARLSTNVHVIYSVKSIDQVCFRDELAGIGTIVDTSSQPRIDRALLAKHITDQPIIYICGSREFSEAIVAHLSALGVPPRDIRRELFTL